MSSERLLGEICEFVNGGAWKQTEYAEDGFPVLQVSNIAGDTFDLSDFKRLSRFSAEAYQKNEILLGDVIIATVGSHAGSASAAGRAVVATPDVVGFLLNQNAVVVRAKSGEINQKYLGYLCKGSSFQRYAQEVGKGAANQMRIGLGALKSYTFDLPEILVQQRIADILSAYDGLIENNRRRIALLEAAARLLYREWFVHFRFPGHEHVKIIDGLPEGWELCTVGEVLELRYGKALKEESRIEGPFPVYGSSGIVGTHEAALVEGPAIVVGRKGNVGSVYWSPVAFWPIDTAYFIPRERSDLWLYLTLPNVGFQNTDGGVPGLNRDFAYSRKMVKPIDRIRRLFNEAVSPMFGQRETLLSYNQKLAQARDLLLPRLMNGDIAV